MVGKSFRVAKEKRDVVGTHAISCILFCSVVVYISKGLPALTLLNYIRTFKMLTTTQHKVNIGFVVQYCTIMSGKKHDDTPCLSCKKKYVVLFKCTKTVEK